MTGVFLPSHQQKSEEVAVKTYAFDPSLDALATLKERFIWMLFMGIVFFLLYGSANQLAGITAPHPSFYMEWERSIPFVEPFIIPYMSSDVMFVIAFFLPYTRYELRVLAARVLFIILLSVLIFVWFPLAFSFEKPQIEEYTFLFGLLEADLPYNQLPSLHIGFAIVLWMSMRNHLKHPLLKGTVALWFLLISLSTLLVYQHHFIDLPTGLLVGLAAIYIIGEDKENYMTVRFTTPRSLKMGLYYLAGAVVMMIFSFVVSELAWFFLWLFLALFTVSVIYAFGLNNLLVGKDGQPNLAQWLLFSPYYAGNYLSWYYYRKKLPLAVEVGNGVYFGRQPTKEEYYEIKHMGVSEVINLAPEQQLHSTFIKQIRLSFLDQTIPSPEALQEGVLLIESMKERGVYVHCALGLSRSVLLISAWLFYQGHTSEEIETFITKMRPGYVKSPYMRITLELYSKYNKLNKKHSYDGYKTDIYDSYG